MSIKDELLGDLEKMSFSTFEDEGRYTAISVKCDDCRLKLQCLKCEGPECRQETLNYIAARLTELGYRKVVECGKCKHWHPRGNDGDIRTGYCTQGYEPLGWEVSEYSEYHYCSVGEPKEEGE